MTTLHSGLKLLVVEDHQLIREMLVLACSQTWPDAIVESATTGEDGLRLIKKLKPDVVLLDLCLPDGDGLDFALKMREACRSTKVIALTSHTDEFTIHRAMHVRLHGFVDKNEQPLDVIRQAVESVLDGHQYLSKTVRRVREEIRYDPVSFSKVLSDREIALLSLLGQGMTNEEIATQIGLAVSTVKLHRNKIMMRIGVHSTPQLMRYALAKGFVHTDSPSALAAGM